ncbi:hypothetical protein HanLR1_Chr03g0095791 [Helianthus annuus]|nr:hypothetical protein HanLR1_Chr03g0095791 [Helianthus annuus]
MVRERADWEKYCERLLKQVQDFEKMNSAFAKEKAAFEAEKKSEEWGREGLKSKLQAAEELLSKKRAEWKEAELNAQVASKDKDLAAKDKDMEIAELKHRLHEAYDKNESLEIDFEAERVKATTAEEAKQWAYEARDISTSALIVAQNNYAEAQSIVDTLVSESEWMRNREVAAIANSILNATEMDAAVAVLIDASRAVGHRGGYLECAHHADAMLARAEEVYDHLSLPVMELVTEALKHDDWCARLKCILDPPKTVELTDEEDAAGVDGDVDGDGDGYE